MLNTRTLRVDHVFHSYVRPVKMPTLSTFCTSLTGITQATVDVAPTFEVVFDAVRQWLQVNDFLDENNSPATRPILTPATATTTATTSSEVKAGASSSSSSSSNVKKIKTFAFATCGDWDLRSMLTEQLAISSIACPSYFRSWINIKLIFSAYSKARAMVGDTRLGMPTMLNALGLPLEGKHHSGIDDVKNLVAVCSSLLRANVVPFDITASEKTVKKPPAPTTSTTDTSSTR
jgi:inhibitor of KinA sporulation pathway (predicted exonuclease)